MDKQQPSQIKRQSKYLRTVNRRTITGTIIATFIAICPYFFYLYESVPKTKVWNTFLFTYNSGFYENANTAMWIVTGKIVPLLLILVWFFTCRHWWYHALLVPIAMYIYQIIALFNDDNQFIDEFHLIYLLPIMAFVIPSIYLIRAKMFNKINDADKSLQDLEDEFRIGPKGFFGKLKDYF